MRDYFATGVAALDEGLITLPVFKSEIGLSHRRTKLETVFAKALRAYFEDVLADNPSVDLEYAVKTLIEELPKPTAGGTHASRY